MLHFIPFDIHPPVTTVQLSLFSSQYPTITVSSHSPYRHYPSSSAVQIAPCTRRKLIPLPLLTPQQVPSQASGEAFFNTRSHSWSILRSKPCSKSISRAFSWVWAYFLLLSSDSTSFTMAVSVDRHAFEYTNFTDFGTWASSQMHDRSRYH